jgi:hypothetical protein
MALMELLFFNWVFVVLVWNLQLFVLLV